MTSDPDTPAAGPLHRRWRAMAIVFVGGIVGTAARYGAEKAAPPTAGHWPWGTFVVNMIGALILGALMGGLSTGADRGARQRLRLLFGVGFCGSLTTYSAFALESDRLLAAHSPLTGLVYVVATVVAGIGCAAAAFVIGRTVMTR